MDVVRHNRNNKVDKLKMNIMILEREGKCGMINAK
jgi:hypothetical protein